MSNRFSLPRLALLTVLATSALLHHGSAHAAQLEANPKAPELCAFELDDSGRLLSGKQYKAQQTLRGVEARAALIGVGRHLAREGYADLSVNLDVGIATAKETVTAGQGATVPITVLAIPKGDGVQVEIIYTLYGGARSSKRLVREAFYEIFEAAGGAPHGSP